MNNELLKKLYHNDKPRMYDLKDEFAKIIDSEESSTNIEKWKKYRDYSVDRYSAYGIDCDVSCIATKIYKNAYKFLNDTSFMKQYKKISFNELDKYFISKNNIKIIPIQNIFCKENIEITYQREYKYQLSLGENPSKEYYRGDTMTSFSNTYNHYENNFSGNKDISNEIEKLAKNHHTIGNMIPVPTGLNIGRAGKFAKFDYWDLTMIQIKKWYDGNKTDERPLKILLDNNDEYVKYCKQWLYHFPEWKDFVEKNYLVQFTTGKDSDYGPKRFWQEHSYDNAELPTDERSFLNYLKLLNEYIENRNIEILNAIKKLK